MLSPYGCDTWTITKEDKNRLTSFDQNRTGRNGIRKEVHGKTTLVIRTADEYDVDSRNYADIKMKAENPTVDLTQSTDRLLEEGGILIR